MANNNNKGRRGNKPQGGKPFRGNRKDKKSEPYKNDYAWWSKYPTLVEGAGDFPFNHIRGTRLPLTGLGETGIPGSQTLASVVAMNYTPTIGVSNTSESPFMTQVRSLWLDMRRKYRGLGTYQVSDLGIFIFCVIDLFASIAEAEQIYGLFRGVQATNRAIPYTILNALGVSYEQGAAELANFRYNLNLINQKASSICLPKGFAAFNDAVTLAGACIKDGDSQRANVYVFDKDVYYVYSGSTYQTGSAALAYYPSDHGQYRYLSDIIDDLNRQLSALLDDDDCAIMASDILAAYGENGVETRQALTEDYITPIVKDENRLLQIHNSTICGGGSISGTSRTYSVVNATAAPLNSGATGGTAGLDITQLNNVLYENLFLGIVGQTGTHTVGSTEISADPRLAIGSLTSYTIPHQAGITTVSTTCPVRMHDRLLDTWNDNVSLEEKVEMTRYTATVDCGYVAANSPWDWVRITSHGLNVITKMSIFKTEGIDTVLADVLGQCTSTSMGRGYAQLSQFDWHPIVYLATRTQWTSPYPPITYTQPGEVMGDIDHCTVIADGSGILPILHEAAVMSAYRCELTSTSKFDVT